MAIDRKKIKVGSVVAFNKLDDATWFDVIKISETGFRLTVREHLTKNAEQTIDISLVARVRKGKTNAIQRV